MTSKQARLDPVTQNTHQELVKKTKVSVDILPHWFVFDLVSSAGQAYTVFISQKSPRKGAGLPLEWQQRGEAEADEASEVDFLEVEYLLLTLDFGDLLFLPAGFGPLQAALLEVFEPGGDGGSLRRAGRVTAVLWEPRERESTVILI